MDYLLRQADRVSQAAAWLCGVALILISLAIVFDVFVRMYFGFSLQGTDELGGYVLAFVGAWTCTYTLFNRAHIRIDSLTRFLPPYARAVLDIVGLAVLGVFITYLSVRCWFVLTDSWEFSSRSITPLQIRLWIPQSVWVAGFFFFLLVIMLIFIKTLTALIKGDIEAVGRLIGTRTRVEEVSDEIAEEPSAIDSRQ